LKNRDFPLSFATTSTHLTRFETKNVSIECGIRIGQGTQIEPSIQAGVIGCGECVRRRFAVARDRASGDPA
jgi:hypothetical protein